MDPQTRLSTSYRWIIHIYGGLEIPISASRSNWGEYIKYYLYIFTILSTNKTQKAFVLSTYLSRIRRSVPIPNSYNIIQGI